MATECGDILTKQVNELLDLANERACQSCRDWEEYAKEMPAIEAASENRAVELLRGNIENSIKDLPKDFFLKDRPNNVLEFDARAIPTEQECRENFRIGREIDMESYEISNFPVIMGIRDPETLERIPGMRDAIKGEMKRLHQSKLSPWFRDSEVVDRIILVDKNASDPESDDVVRGATPTQKEFIADKALPRAVHVFRDPDTGKMHAGQELHRVVIHEICHLNLNKGKDSSGERDFRGIFHEKHRDEWLVACKAQTEGRSAPGASPGADYSAPANSPDEVRFLKSDFICDHVACWDADVGVEICPEMQSFFDKYLT